MNPRWPRVPLEARRWIRRASLLLLLLSAVAIAVEFGTRDRASGPAPLDTATAPVDTATAPADTTTARAAGPAERPAARPSQTPAPARVAGRAAPRTAEQPTRPGEPAATAQPAPAAPAPAPAAVAPAVAPAGAPSVPAAGAVLREAPSAREMSALLAGREAVVLAPGRPYPAAEPASMRSLFVEVPADVVARGGTFVLAEPGPWQTLGARGGVIARGDAAPLAFTVMVPALAPAGENRVGVVRFVPNDAREYYDVPMVVDVATRTLVSLLAVQPVIGARAGERVRTAWTIRNDGNADVEVSLGFAAASGWRVRPAAGDVIRVGRGSAVSIPVDVEVPAGVGGGDFALVGTVRTRSGVTARDEQGWLVAGAAGRSGAGGIANLRVGSVQDDAGQAVQAYAADFMVPLRDEVRLSGRVGALSRLGSGLTAATLGGLGFADRVGQVDLRAPGWSLTAGSVGFGRRGLSGFGLFGDGAVASLDGREWRGDAVAMQPVGGGGRYLYGRTQRRVGDAWLGVMASDLADGLFVDRAARTLAVDAAVPTPLGALEVQAGVRQTTFGDGAALQLDLARRLGRWGYSVSAGHAPGGAAAFAAAENSWGADAYREVGEDVTLSGSAWGNNDQARADRRFRSSGMASRASWRVRPTLSLDAELRQSGWESETPLGGVANGDRMATVGAALARGAWQWRGSARGGTVRREADLLGLGRVATDAAQAAMHLSATRSFAAANVSATASSERTGAGVGLPAQLSSLELRADRLPLWPRRAYAYAEYGVVVLGSTGSRLDAQTVGVDLQLPAQLGVTLEASRNALFRRAGSAGTPWVVALRVQQGLALPGAGNDRVLGVVFLDENANGRRDRGERGLPGVVVEVDDVPASTDRDGRFRGPAGAQAVVDVRSLPAGFLVAPRTAAAARGDIAIVPTAPVLVQLRVENPDRAPMGAVDLARAVVILRDARGRVWSNAVGADGRVRFDALPLGRYHVEVETSAVGEALAPRGTLPVIDVDGTPRQGPLTVILTPRPMRVQPIPAPRRVHLGGAQGRRERP